MPGFFVEKCKPDLTLFACARIVEIRSPTGPLHNFTGALAMTRTARLLRIPTLNELEAEGLSFGDIAVIFAASLTLILGPDDGVIDGVGEYAGRKLLGYTDECGRWEFPAEWFEVHLVVEFAGDGTLTPDPTALLRRVADATEAFDEARAAYGRNSILYTPELNPSKADYQAANDELGEALSAAVKFFE